MRNSYLYNELTLNHLIYKLWVLCKHFNKAEMQGSFFSFTEQDYFYKRHRWMLPPLSSWLKLQLCCCKSGNLLHLQEVNYLSDSAIMMRFLSSNDLSKLPHWRIGPSNTSPLSSNASTWIPDAWLTRLTDFSNVTAHSLARQAKNDSLVRYFFFLMINTCQVLVSLVQTFDILSVFCFFWHCNLYLGIWWTVFVSSKWSSL